MPVLRSFVRCAFRAIKIATTWRRVTLQLSHPAVIRGKLPVRYTFSTLRYISCCCDYAAILCSHEWKRKTSRVDDENRRVSMKYWEKVSTRRIFARSFLRYNRVWCNFRKKLGYSIDTMKQLRSKRYQIFLFISTSRRSSIREAGNIVQRFSRIDTNDGRFTERRIVQVTEVNAFALSKWKPVSEVQFSARELALSPV